MSIHSLTLPDGSIQPVLIRTTPSRRSYSIRWDQELPLLSVPRGTSLPEASRILNRHRRWILRRKNARERDRQFLESPTISGNERHLDSIRIGGNPLFLHWVEQDQRWLRHDPARNCLVLSGPVPELREYQEEIRSWMFCWLSSRILSELDFWIKRTGLSPTGVSIRTTRSQWGSMSRKGRLSVSWFLMSHPGECISYLILHELVHIRHPNHSKAFWDQVEQNMENYREIRSTLSSFPHFPDWGSLLPGDRKKVQLAWPPDRTFA
ncbi:MAG: M48 family metallopeptidase [Leptospirales bacterium]